MAKLPSSDSLKRLRQAQRRDYEALLRAHRRDYEALQRGLPEYAAFQRAHREAYKELRRAQSEQYETARAALSKPEMRDFLRGLGDLLDIAGDDRIRRLVMSDAASLRGDWLMVGNDLWTSLEALTRELAKLDADQAADERPSDSGGETDATPAPARQ
jgi:hypothetical protein